MSSGYVAIPFVVDMNAARISAPWLGQLLSLVQQIGAAVSNRIVGRHRSAWPEARRTECEVFDIPRRDKDGWGFARSASRPQRSADAHLDLLACGAPANIRHSPDGAQAEVRRRWDYRPVLTRPRGRMQDAAPVVRRSPLRARLGPPTLVATGSGLGTTRRTCIAHIAASVTDPVTATGIAQSVPRLTAKPW